jgi:serine/threonine protein kinase
MVALQDKEQTYFKAEDIEMKEEIGSGNFGSVYRADFQGNSVALKKLSAEDIDGFKREASTLKQLRHPNVVRFVLKEFLACFV